MTRADVQAAVTEAERFVARAKVLLASKPETYRPETHDYAPEPWNGNGDPVRSGAVRRASLDLTRALAHMRRRGG